MMTRQCSNSLKFLLEVVGYQVVVHASARGFLNDRASRPACLIVDQHMPGMTGLDLTQTLRDDGDTIPVLLITGSPSPAIVARAAQLGIVNVLEKPPKRPTCWDLSALTPDPAIRSAPVRPRASGAPDPAGCLP